MQGIHLKVSSPGKLSSLVLKKGKSSLFNPEHQPLQPQSAYRRKSGKVSSPNLVHLSQKVLGEEDSSQKDFFPKKENKFDISILHDPYIRYPTGVQSRKAYRYYKAYAANSYQGITRNYNEDRLVIIPNVKRPKHFNGKTWPHIGLFAIFDGHGGDRCADFLKDHLHTFIINDENFPINIRESIKNGFSKAEKAFEEIAIDQGDNTICKDESGTCACVVILVENIIYTANVGDSRAIMSSEHGKVIRQLTYDHKPNVPKEYNRIIKSGAKVYCDYMQEPEDNSNDDLFLSPYKTKKKPAYSNSILPKITAARSKCNMNLPKMETNLNPRIYRVLPSTLAVSRTLGDVCAKYPQFGGIPGSIIANPDIGSFELSMNVDFILIGCDGIYDVLSNEEIAECVWTAANQEKTNDINETAINGVNMVIKAAMNRKSEDNVSCIIIGMENLEKGIKRNRRKSNMVTTHLLNKNNSCGNFSTNTSMNWPHSQRIILKAM